MSGADRSVLPTNSSAGLIADVTKEVIQSLIASRTWPPMSKNPGELFEGRGFIASCNAFCAGSMVVLVVVRSISGSAATGAAFVTALIPRNSTITTGSRHLRRAVNFPPPIGESSPTLATVQQVRSQSPLIEGPTLPVRPDLGRRQQACIGRHRW